VLFFHRDPVDDAVGFRPETDRSSTSRADGTRGATGTEDLLLDVDIVEALVQAATPAPGSGGAWVSHPDRLRERLAQARLGTTGIRLEGDGPALFDADGDRRPGTGEHVAWLRPRIERNGRVLPEAT